MFSYARIDGDHCNNDGNSGCECHCENHASKDGTCFVMSGDKDWDLYSLVINKQSKSNRFSYDLVHSNISVQTYFE